MTAPPDDRHSAPAADLPARMEPVPEPVLSSPPPDWPDAAQPLPLSARIPETVSEVWYRVLLRLLRPLLRTVGRTTFRTLCRVGRWLRNGLIVLFLLFACLHLLLRHVLLPNVGQWQPQLEAALQTGLGIPVQIGSVHAEWSGLNPGVQLRQLRLLDRRGQPGLSLAQVDVILSWKTLWRGELTLDLLQIQAPVLQIRRLPDGQLSIAGLDLPAGSDEEGHPLDWLLAQNRIRIHDAIVVWEDLQRGAPPLALEDVQFGLDNRGSRHRFALNAQPPDAWGQRLDVRGDLLGEDFSDFAHLAAWNGKLFVDLARTDLSVWQRWLDYPLPLQGIRDGQGSLRLWADLDGAGGVAVTSDLDVQALRLYWPAQQKQVWLDHLHGRLKVRQQRAGWQIEGRQLALQTRGNNSNERTVSLPATDFLLQWEHRQPWSLLRWLSRKTLPENTGSEGDTVVGKASASTLDLGLLAQLANRLPLPDKVQTLLARHQPQGTLDEPVLGWEIADGRLRHYQFHSRFAGLGSLPVGALPGFSGLDGELRADIRGGKLTLDSHHAALDLPEIMAEPHLDLQRLQVQLDWIQALEPASHGSNDSSPGLQALDVRLRQAQVANADASLKSEGRYGYRAGQGLGRLELESRIDRAEARAVWRYLPKQLKPETRAWLRRALTQGRASGTLHLAGRLEDFPYRNPETGRFEIILKAERAGLDYAPGWPALENMAGEVRFVGPGLFITAKQAGILDARVGTTHVTIPDFGLADPILRVQGRAAGETAAFVRFLNASPVGGMIGDLTANSETQGQGQLQLLLDLPLKHLKDSKVRGSFTFQENRIHLMPELPEFRQVGGELHFHERGVQIPGLRAQVFGHPGRFSGGGQDGNFVFELQGGANIREVGEYLDQPLFAFFSGQTNWRGKLKVSAQGAELRIDSDLSGITSSLPEPLRKAAATPLPLRVEISPQTGSGAGSNAGQLYHVTAGKLADVRLLARPRGKRTVIERAAVAIGGDARLPERGLAVAVNLPQAAFADWKPVLDVLLFADLPPATAAPKAAGDDGPELNQIALNFGQLQILGREFSGLQVRGNRLRDSSKGWQLLLEGPEIAGDVFWNHGGKGRIRAELKRLHLLAGQPVEATSPQASVLNTLPDMDIRVADLVIDRRRFGRLDLEARNDGGLWRLERVVLDNPDGHFQGKGMWRNQNGHRTQLEFELESSNVGNLLERMGHPGTIRRGSAHLRGNLNWNGPPSALDYPSLNGELTLAASRGQFAKLEPGFGKLLGLLSLQALPRRITLDFRDVFSDGFAFDSVESRLTVQHGIMRTRDELRIDGPAARVVMKGEVDLSRERQNLNVTVQPQIAGVAALGAIALANPVAGVATLIANSVLPNPINRLFSFRYQIGGTWDNPVISKQGSTMNVPDTSEGATPAKPEGQGTHD